MLSAAAIVLAASFVAHAVVVPNEPGPGSVFTEGGDCHIAWTGDSESTTAWKDMSITLRTGSNLDMQTITEIASGQDGTVDGTYDYPCPDVTPQSAIYFYEFRAPGATADGPQWTTRFTIAAANGDTVPPPESVQPDGAEIPWGIGTLESGEASGITAVVSSTDAPTTLPPATSTAALATTATSRMTTVRTSATEEPTTANAAVSTPSSEPNAASSHNDARLMCLCVAIATMAFTLML